jgi:hypothetical protein
MHLQAFMSSKNLAFRPGGKHRGCVDSERTSAR